MSYNQNYPPRGPKPTIDSSRAKIPAFKSTWITEGIRAEAIEYAEELGKQLIDLQFTSSQIRNFYGELKRIQMGDIKNNKASFLLLHPKIAYAAKRSKSDGAMLFKEEILKAHAAVNIDQQDPSKSFQNFCDLCEAILAFHKAHGGKDN